MSRAHAYEAPTVEALGDRQGSHFLGDSILIAQPAISYCVEVFPNQNTAIDYHFVFYILRKFDLNN